MPEFSRSGEHVRTTQISIPTPAYADDGTKATEGEGGSQDHLKVKGRSRAGGCVHRRGGSWPSTWLTRPAEANAVGTVLGSGSLLEGCRPGCWHPGRRGAGGEARWVVYHRQRFHLHKSVISLLWRSESNTDPTELNPGVGRAGSLRKLQARICSRPSQLLEASAFLSPFL